MQIVAKVKYENIFDVKKSQWGQTKIKTQNFNAFKTVVFLYLAAARDKNKKDKKRKIEWGKLIWV